MAARGGRRSQAPTDDAAGLVSDPATLDGSDPDVDALDSFLEEIGANPKSYTVKVFKRRADGNRIGSCRSFPLEDFDPDQLPVMFGGGEFTLRIIDKGPPARFVRAIHLFYDPEIFPPKPPAAGPSARPDAPAAAANGDPVLAARLAALEGQLSASTDRYVRLLEQLVTARAPQAQDPIATLRSMMEIVQLSGGARTPGREMADVMKTALDFAREANGGGGGDTGDPISMAVSALIPKLIEVMSNAAARGPAGAVAPAPSRVVAPAPAPAAGAPPAPRMVPGNGYQVKLPPEWEAFAFLRGQTDQLLHAATTNADPAFVGSYAYGKVPDDYLADLQRFVMLPAAERAGLVSALDSRLSSYMPYIEKVVDTIREEFEGDNADAS